MNLFKHNKRSRRLFHICKSVCDHFQKIYFFQVKSEIWNFVCINKSQHPNHAVSDFCTCTKHLWFKDEIRKNSQQSLKLATQEPSEQRFSLNLHWFSLLGLFLG